ncbi:MAG: type II secretion system secretin GspD [Nitrospirota bacterium]|nr:type II secretion system secretin GspD [Nitrospirota bacterium]
MKILAALGALLALLTSGVGVAQELPAEIQGNLVRIDFENVDLQAMVRFISKITGKNFIVDDSVRGKVSIVTPDKVSVDQAYQIFLSVLNLKGFTVVQAGPAIKIIPTKDARNVPLPLITPGFTTPEGEMFVTEVLKLRYVDSQDLAGLLQNMMSQDGLIAAYPTTNSIILIDTATNISRLKELAKEFDVAETFSKIMIIPLEYASCTDMADKVLSLFGEGYGTAARRLLTRGRAQRGATPRQLLGGMLKVIPDERTNSLIVMADPAQASQIREVVKRLDVQTPSTYGNMFVYYLKNAGAEEVAKVLQELARTELSEQTSTQAGQALTKEAQLGVVTGQFQGPVKIAADKGTNSIIVFASQQDYRMIETVLKKLDIRRNQVFVQGLIATLSVNASRDLGVWIKGGGNVGNNAVGGQTLPGGGPGTSQGSATGMLPSQGGLGALPSQMQSGQETGAGGMSAAQAGGQAFSSTFMNPFSLPGFAATAISGGMVNIGGQQIPLWQAVIQAVAADSRSDVLSTPYLLAMDNQEAEINVGQEVPMQAGTTLTSTGMTQSSIERQPVGIILKITPKISEGDLIQLEIYQEVSQVDRSASYTDQFGYTTNKRTAKTHAVVKDNATIIIGGLIDTNVSKITSKVPILGSIPILGYLFKTEGTQATKQNLIILLTPHIIRTPSDIDRYRIEQELMFEEFRRRNKIHLRPERLREGNY